MRQHDQVYLIDEEPESRQALLCSLLHLDARIICQPTAESCLASHVPGTPGCIVLSVGGSGGVLQSALSTIKQTAQLLPTIALVERAPVNVAVSAMKLGAADFLEKPVDVAALQNSVRECLLRSARLCEHWQAVNAQATADKLPQLTFAERRVLEGIVAGLPMQEIANNLDVSLRTTHKHRKSGMRRLGLQNRADLLRISSVFFRGSHAPRYTSTLTQTA